MTRSTLRLLLAGALAVLAFVVAACGGDDDKSSSSTSSSTQAAKADVGTDDTAAAEVKGKKGGKITSWPAPTSTSSTRATRTTRSGYKVVYPTQRTLYSFKPTDSDEPVPDLADGDAADLG